MKKLLIAIPLLLGSTSVLAQGFNYTFVQAGYLDGETENINADGYGLSGSLAFTDNLFAKASYSSLEPDGRSRFDFNDTSLGLGFHTPLSNGVDLVFTGSWINSEVDLGRFGSYDEDGYGLGAGFRTWLAPSLELNGGLEYVDFGGSAGNDTAVGLGLLYTVTGNLALGISGSWGNDPDFSALGLNVRLYLGR
ncbi:MAG: hypothetical protein R3F41_07540 [Gammaproteobacteria bacterium]|nr:hypothetical protein [Pseudomonadales bacterium]